MNLFAVPYLLLCFGIAVAQATRRLARDLKVGERVPRVPKGLALL